MSPRQQQPAALVARIRAYDLRACSDQELRDSLAQLRPQAGPASEGDIIARAFALVAEAVDRRLGLWRILARQPEAQDRLAAAAGECPAVAAWTADIASQRQHRHDGDILLPGEFYQAVRGADPGNALCFRATDEQLLAGIHLYRGRVAQMDAGEGKTVAAAFPAVLRAISGFPVHIITANDYLAGRDANLLEPLYRSLGLSVGALLQHMEDGERRQVYRRDVVYGTMRELGFDFLRDNLKSDPSGRVLPAGKLAVTAAIVDEADHALIDEASTPMIISGTPVGSARAAIRADRVVSEMVGHQRRTAERLAEQLDEKGAKSPEIQRRAARLLLADPGNPGLKRFLADHPGALKRAWSLAEEVSSPLTGGLLYAIHPGRRFVTLTDQGREFVERRLGPLYEGTSTQEQGPHEQPGYGLDGLHAAPSRRHGLGNQVLQSLRAHLLLQRDVDYLVSAYGVVLIDRHTGRAKPDSIYQYGLQAAVEARERVPVRPEGETLAWLSVAGYMSCYGQVSGITGTATPAAAEFRRRYGLEVAVVPPALPSLRTVCPPRVYLSSEDKTAAAAEETANRHRLGQPVLLAARTVEQSEELSRELTRRGIPHHLLNAVTSASEARIVRHAGSYGAVTVSTPMAGRGTDILLEPGLNHRLAGTCADEIARLLSAEALSVSVSCPSETQASVLTSELDRRNLAWQLRAVGRARHIVIPGGRGNAEKTLDFAMGLCVIGTELYDSRRTELQLYGRSGRQGEFGITTTFLSLEDTPVTLHATDFLKLSRCQQTDAPGRVFYAGPAVTRLAERLQSRLDAEEESVRGFTHDYIAEFDRQAHLYYRRRQRIADAVALRSLSRETAERVASRLAAIHLGTDADGDYRRRFRELSYAASSRYGLDVSSLYGCDLTLLPGELARLFQAGLERAAHRAGERLFPRMARLLLLQVCGELWPAHLAALRDLMATQMLGGMAHKSSVARYIAHSHDAWTRFWEDVDEEFVSRLMSMPTGKREETATVLVSPETQRLLAQDTPSNL